MKQEHDELCYPVKKVQFRTCVELYQKWKITKLRYKTAPSNGIEVEVEYADTLELINPDLESNFSINSKLNEYDDLENIKCFPLNSEVGACQRYKPLTALCLHGAPGSHKDYQHLIKYLIKRNVRVIAPKFPSMYILRQCYVNYLDCPTHRAYRTLHETVSKIRKFIYDTKLCNSN